MRTCFVLLPFIALFVAACTTAAPIPPQVVRAGESNEPRTMMLSEMCAEMGWRYQTGPGAFDYTAISPKGDRVLFTINRDVVIINGTRWRQERDAVEIRGRDLLLPESTFDFVCRHFNMHHLVRGGVKTATTDYVLDSINPATPAAPPARIPEKAPSSSALRGLTICIDAGHGGKDPGGEANGVQEKDVCLAVAVMLRDLCEDAAAKVIMTRTTDEYPDLDQRVRIANSAKVDLFLSIHANIAPNSAEVQGFEAFYRGNNEAAGRFARALTDAMDRAIDSPNRGAKKDPRGLRVLENTTMPAVLFELGFMSNPQEARRLSNKAYQQHQAKALFEGISAHWARLRPSVSR